MNILIAVASKHGSTREIAEAIAGELRQADHTVTVRDVGETGAIADYDAVIVGSAVYMGNWLDPAQVFVAQNQAHLATVPVWLFSSGPLGEEPPPEMGSPATLDKLMEQSGALEHQVFVGKLDKNELGLGERLIARAVKAPEGDFRDWEAIHRWARKIASTLKEAATTPAGAV